jgi:hypothetical protein
MYALRVVERDPRDMTREDVVNVVARQPVRIRVSTRRMFDAVAQLMLEVQRYRHYSVWIDLSIAFYGDFERSFDMYLFASARIPFGPYVQLTSDILRRHSANISGLELDGEFDVAVLDVSHLRPHADMRYRGSRPPTAIRADRLGLVAMTLDPEDGRCRPSTIFARAVHELRLLCRCDEIDLLPTIRNIEGVGKFAAWGFDRCDAEAIVRAPQFTHVELPARVVTSDMRALRAALDRADVGEYVAIGSIEVDASSPFFQILRLSVTSLEIELMPPGTELSITRTSTTCTLRLDGSYYARARSDLFSGEYSWPRLVEADFDHPIGRAPLPSTLDRRYQLFGVPALRYVGISNVRPFPVSSFFAMPSTISSVGGDAVFSAVPPFPRLMWREASEHPGRAIQAFLTAVETSPARGLARLREQDPRPYLLYVMRLLTDDEYMRVVFGERWEDSIVATARSTRSTR